jgi:hypothetical protein
VNPRVKFRLWMSVLLTAERDAITDSYAWPPRAPLTQAEHAQLEHLYELEERVHDDACRLAGVEPGTDDAAVVWQAAGALLRA